MKQVFFLQGKAVTVDVPQPEISDYEVLVRNSYSAISAGTEKSSMDSSGKSIIGLIKSQPELIKQGMEFLKRKGLKSTFDLAMSVSKPSLNTTGYSTAGTVVKVGRKIMDLMPGDKVACAGAGYAFHAEYVSVPRNLVARIPENVSLLDASFTTIGSIAMQSVRRLEPQIGETIAVFGLGLLGVIATQLLVASGCRVIGIDVREDKLKFAEQFGPAIILKAGGSLESKIKAFTDGYGVDKTLLALTTKSNIPMVQSIEITRKRGRIISLGVHKMDIPRKNFYLKEIDFGLSCSYGPGRYDKVYEEKSQDYPQAFVRWTENRNMQSVLNLVADKKLNISALIDNVFEVDNSTEAFERVQNLGEKPAVAFKYDEKAELSHVKVTPAAQSSGKNVLNISVIGAGGFAKSQHLPNITAISALKLRGIVNKTGKSGKETADEYKPDYYTTEPLDVIKDKDTDIALIATRHDTHAELTISTLKAGKNAFVEKPLCLVREELDEIRSVLGDSGKNICLGFNRRYAPAIIDLKKQMKEMNAGAGSIVNIRVVSAGMVAEHWVNDIDIGGGALIGEGCHFVDLARFLGDSEITGIQASALSSGDKNIMPANNFSVLFKFENGILVNLTYVTIGSRMFPKEKIEVYTATGVIEMIDYQKLDVYTNGKKSINYQKQDKGVKSLLMNYTDFLKGDQSNLATLPVNAEAIKSMETTFDVFDALRNLK